jgi:hypothetical protein
MRSQWASARARSLNTKQAMSPRGLVACLRSCHGGRPGRYGPSTTPTNDIVNDADAAILAAHWGEDGGEASVPEPGSLALLAGIAVMGVVCLRRRDV